MKTKSKLERILDAIQNADKEELMDIVQGLNKAEILEMAEIMALLRAADHKVPASPFVEIIRPLKEDNDDEQEGIIENIQEEISDEEHKEIEEKYGERAKAPQSEFIKYESPEQFLDLILKNKKEKGWKFKDEE